MNRLRLHSGEDIISSAEIASVVERMAEDYTKMYQNVDELHIVTLLQGAIPFATDLSRKIRHPNILMDDMRAKSYDGIQAGGKVQIVKETSLPVRGSHVLLVEDILDKGNTLSLVTKHLSSQNPASLAVASLLEKPTERLPDTPLQADDVQIGLQIENVFVVGYGLDWNNRFRALGHITKAFEIEPGVYSPLVPEEAQPQAA